MDYHKQPLIQTQAAEKNTAQQNARQQARPTPTPVAVESLTSSVSGKPTCSIARDFNSLQSAGRSRSRSTGRAPVTADVHTYVVAVCRLGLLLQLQRLYLRCRGLVDCIQWLDEEWGRSSTYICSTVQALGAPSWRVSGGLFQ